MELETYLHPHILGALYGQALADAWGMPAFFRPEQTWSFYNGWLDRLVAGPPDHPLHAGFQAGQFTGRTQQALILMNHIINNGPITVESVATAIVEWYDQIDGDNSTLVGPNTRRAVLALKEGEDPHQTGLRGETSGGAMRASAPGLIHPGNPEGAIEEAITACTPTHCTGVALSGACAVAAAVARAIMPDTTLEDIIDVAINAAEIGLRRGVPWFGASIARKIDFAVQVGTDINLTERERLQNLYDLIGATPAAADAVPCAFGVLAMANGNPIDTAIFAANLSGAANTIGSMAGPIAGAWQGINTIPIEYIEIIRQANPHYNFEEIAEALYEIGRTNYHAAQAQIDAPSPNNFLENNRDL